MAEDNRNIHSEEKLEEARKIADNSKKNNSVISEVEGIFFRMLRWLSSLIDKIVFSSKYLGPFSLALAILMCVVVYVTENNSLTSTLSSSKTLNNVSVNARYNSESFELSGVPSSCQVVLTGDAANVNSAASKTGACSINLEGYTEGTHTVSLTASGYGDNVTTVVTPSEATITLKKKTTAQFELSYDFINKNQLDSKYILGTPEFSTGTDKINIRASQDTLNSIALVKALIDVSGQKSDFTVEAPLVAYDAKGKAVDAEIVPATVTATVKISSPHKTVPIVLNLVGNAPKGFAIDTVQLDHQTTEIYAPESVLQNVNEVSVNLDLSTLAGDTDIVQPVVLPAGVNSSDITTVNVKATLAAEVSKTIDNIPINYKNNENSLAASSVDYTSVSVTVTGTQSNIDQITENDIIAYIDIKGLEPGEYDLPIIIEKNSTAYVSLVSNPTSIKITLVNKG